MVRRGHDHETGGGGPPSGPWSTSASGLLESASRRKGRPILWRYVRRPGERGGLLTRFSPSRQYVGRWVQVRSRDWGFGFCTDKRPEGAVVVYTDIPGVAQKQEVVPVEDLLLPRVSRGTRVWLRGQLFGWHAAEITGWAGAGGYHVRVAGMSHDLQLTDDQFAIRWGRPLSDPLTALARGL